jgi:hypothetical protein
MRPFPLAPFGRYRVSLQRKKRRQQIISLNYKPFSIAVCIDAIKEPLLSEMLGDAVRPALCVYPVRDDFPLLHGITSNFITG